MSDSGERNPWLNIPASDYEGHMGPLGTDQSTVLRGILADLCAQTRPRRLAVLGAGMGNGFEHIDLTCTTRVVAVDAHPEYLGALRARHAGLAPVLEAICAPVETCELAPASVDVVHAALIFEYTDVAPLLGRIAAWLVAGGLLSVVLQLPSEVPAVTPTPYESLRLLEGFMRLVPPEALEREAGRVSLELVGAREAPLRFGKRFWVGRLQKRV
jgi:hypothetical protein